MGYLFNCDRDLIVSRELSDGARFESEVFLQADENDGRGWTEVADFAYPLLSM
jgi:hypothetical protein